jgi:hypothetical protein
MIALSSRFSRRPAGYSRLIAAIKVDQSDDLTDGIVYLEAPAL